ncbi:hypothetical protein ACLESO_11390 [Pyxidicoccus sp. 3LG]
MTPRTHLRPLLLGWTLLLAPTAGSAPAPKGISITSIDAQVYDRQKGAIVAMGEASDPYGMNGDAFIVVKLQGTHDGDAPLKLKLVASAPKESSEAGDSPGFKVTQTRDLHALAENGVTQVPFLIPYSCASKVTLTATLTGPGVKGSKTLSTSFPCAE